MTQSEWGIWAEQRSPNYEFLVGYQVDKSIFGGTPNRPAQRLAIAFRIVSAAPPLGFKFLSAEI